MKKAVRLAAVKQSVLLGPAYTSKAMAEPMWMAEKRELIGAENVLLVHAEALYRISLHADSI